MSHTFTLSVLIVNRSLTQLLTGTFRDGSLASRSYQGNGASGIRQQNSTGKCLMELPITIPHYVFCWTSHYVVCGELRTMRD